MINYRTPKTLLDTTVRFAITIKQEKMSRTENKEKGTELTYISNGVRKMYSPNLKNMEKDSRMIGYITDIHIPHRLKQIKAEDTESVLMEIRSVAGTIASQTDLVLLIGGDISGEPIIYEAFIAELRKELDKRNKQETCVVLVLGNHELLCSSPGYLCDTVKEYKKITQKYNMVLLYNELLYHSSSGLYGIIREEQLDSMSREEIRAQLRTADMIILGGVGFSGCNEILNAETGIYGRCLTRTQEMEESSRFLNLHNKVHNILGDKHVIVFTHMPVNCWNSQYVLADGFTYVSGHTHYNEYRNEGMIRFIADNQVGYKRRKIFLKFFPQTVLYDYFADTPDGIHRITPEDQVLFYQGKGLYSGLTRTDGKVYLLKRAAYHCFMFYDEKENLYILNGGAISRLKRNEIEYYYRNMPAQIRLLLNPLKKYTEVQKTLAEGVKRIGGKGIIHGAIVDIDDTSHIYLNPLDGKITGYWASDMVNKVTYPTIKLLLRENCPWIYYTYKELSGPKGNILKEMERKNSFSVCRWPERYEDTDIYSISNKVLKMQKLYQCILALWVPLPGEEQKKIMSD